jgi:hypothetical protein
MQIRAIQTIPIALMARHVLAQSAHGDKGRWVKD